LPELFFGESDGVFQFPATDFQRQVQQAER